MKDLFYSTPLANKDSAKHSGIISLFNRYFVKTEMIDKKFSKILAKAKIYRERGDYGDFLIVSTEEVTEQIENAEEFLKEIKKYIDNLAQQATIDN